MNKIQFLISSEFLLMFKHSHVSRSWLICCTLPYYYFVKFLWFKQCVHSSVAALWRRLPHDRSLQPRYLLPSVRGYTLSYNSGYCENNLMRFTLRLMYSEAPRSYFAFFDATLQGPINPRNKISGIPDILMKFK